MGRKKFDSIRRLSLTAAMCQAAEEAANVFGMIISKAGSNLG
jgi:hypothetical protein